MKHEISPMVGSGLEFFEHSIRRPRSVMFRRHEDEGKPSDTGLSDD